MTSFLPEIEALGADGKRVIVVYNSFIEDIVALNNVYKPLPEGAWEYPVVVIAKRDAPLLDGQVMDSFKVGGTINFQVESSNIQGNIAANSLEPSGKTIVISTPLTGWFTCGGERGPGIAILLSLADYISQQEDRKHDYMFFGTIAHELNSYGAEYNLERMEEIGFGPENVHVWLTLGASIATHATFDEATGEGQGASTQTECFAYFPLLNSPLAT